VAVVQLVEYRSRETAQVLQALADKARRGEVVAVALCYRTSDQEEHVALTGAYKASPSRGVNAAMRLSWRLTQIQDEMTGTP
jgi:hypothetical protein